MSDRKPRRALRILVIDIGGSHIKVRLTGHPNSFEIVSGPRMTARRMVTAVESHVDGHDYDVVSIGYPGLVLRGRPHRNPPNLGKGWVRFNFTKAFGCPVKMVNDAAMQALGSYHGGKMLFLGLGTGLGSALLLDGVLHAMELGDLPYREDGSVSDYVSKAALKRLGLARWQRHVSRLVNQLARAFQPDYTVVGGGQAKLVAKLLRGVEVVDNSKAFLGGQRLWLSPAILQRCAKPPSPAA